MKKAMITISYDEEKLEALKMYLEEKSMDLDTELIRTIDTLYTKKCPFGGQGISGQEIQGCLTKEESGGEN